MWCDDSEERAWLDARIAATRAEIIATEAAISQVAGGAVTYSLDTGQSRQSVTKATPGELRLLLNDLENRLSTLLAKRNGAGFYARPGY